MKKMESDQIHKQFFPNLISNSGIFVLNVLIGLWFTPYLIRYLGVAAYGLVPLATSLTSYLSLINLSLNGAAGRFLTIDLQKGDVESANGTFNTVLMGNLALVALTIPLTIGLILKAPRLFNIPNGHEKNAQWLFGATLIAYLITVIQSSFSVSSWARNRFDLRNAVIAIYHLLRVGIVIILFPLTKPALWQVGLGIFAATIVGFLGDIYLWRKLTPQLHFQFSKFDRSRVHQLFGMSSWMMVNQIGTLLFLKIDLIIANTMLGAEIAGGYGSVLLFSTMLRQLAQTASTVLTPTILTKYSHGDLEAVNRISQHAVKFIGLAMALPIGLICGFAQPLLVLWLGPKFLPLAGLLVMLTAHLAINLAVAPLFGLNVALNKVAVPGVVTLIMGVINIGLAIAFVMLGWGALGIAAAGAILLTLKNALFTPVYAALIQKLPWWTFLKTILPITVAALATGWFAYIAAQFIPICSWVTLILVGGFTSVLYLVTVYFGLLNREDRNFLIKFLPSR
jgi:membrane protein EpsK